MKILFITDNFPPECNAPAKRTFEHTRQWVKFGHDVTVITGAPNFPIGKVFEGYKNKLFQTENIEDINIKRVWTYIAANKGFLLRVIDYISFMVSSFICGLFTKKHDVVIATSPQFFTAISGYFIALFKRSHYVLEIRDLWPESIVAVGAMKETNLIIRILYKIAFFLYKRARIIVCVTDSFKQDLINKGVDSDKIVVIKNGFDFDNIILPTKTIAQIEKEYNLSSDDFIVSFIGTIGMAHGLDIILRVSQNMDQKVKFLIVGDGAEKDILERKAKSKNLDNVIFISSIAWQEIINLDQIIAVNFVHLIDNPEFRKVIPSKIFESMALKKPIIMGVSGEARNIVKEAGCGIDIEPENDKSLILAINKCLKSPILLNQKGLNGFNYVFKKFNRKDNAKEIINQISSYIKK